MRAESDVVDASTPVPGSVDLLAAAAALRWVRPDLTAALADHVLDTALAAEDRDRWLSAAGWAVHGRAAVGDARDKASEVLADVPRWGAEPLAAASAGRLRVELALLAVEAGEVARARVLLAPVVVDGPSPVLRADAVTALARCAVVDASVDVRDVVRDAQAAWAEADDPVGPVAVAIVATMGHRRAGRADAAADAASAGLTQLEQARGPHAAASPSGHLAAALTAEWLLALLDAGRADEARRGCVPLAPRLAEPVRPGKQLVRLRLAVARVAAPSAAPSTTAEVLEKAADDASAADVPDLESVSRSALGAVLQRSGRTEAADEAVQAGARADDLDRHRGSRFTSLLGSTSPEGAGPGRRPVGDPEVAASGNNGRGEATGDEVGAGTPSIGPGVAGMPAVDTVRWPTFRFPTDDELVAGRRRDDEPAMGMLSARHPGGSPIGDMVLRSLRRGHAGDGGPDRVGNGGPAGGRPADRAGEPGDTVGDDRTSDAGRDGGGERGGGERGGGERGAGARGGGERGGGERRAGARGAGNSRADGRGTGADGEPGAPERGAERDRSTAADVGVGVGVGVGRAVRVDGPWATGSWTTRPTDLTGTPPAGVPVPADPGGVPVRAAPERSDAQVGRDRAAGRPAADEPGPEPGQERVGIVECLVVIDVARAGRRFAGRRAAGVVRAVAERLAGRLPAGARLRDEPGDGLSIVLSGWDRGSAAAWMHRSIPGLLADFTGDDDLPGLQLRAVVHSADGPVGAQILQRLDRPPVRPRAPASTPEPAPPVLPRQVRRTLEGGSGNGGSADPASDADRAEGGRHQASDRTPFRGPGHDVTPGSGGRRHRPDADDPPAVDPAGEPASLDGLGLADLLAGALAAYRGM